MSQSALETAPVVVLRMEGDVALLSPNAVIRVRGRKGGVQRIRKLKDDWHLRALDAWNRAGCPVFPGKVRLSYVVYRGRTLDEDNLQASEAFKAIQDALVGRAYPDDSPKFVERGNVEQITGKEHRECPVLLLRIDAVSLEPQETGQSPGGSEKRCCCPRRGPAAGVSETAPAADG